MTIYRLSKLQQELLLELWEAQNQFKAGELKGTIRSRVLHHMARARDKLLPAPVSGKSQTTSEFQGVFSRAVSRLVSLGLVETRKVGGDFKGLPYQWGFAHHARQQADLFLTFAGEEEVQRLRQDASPKTMPAAAPAGKLPDPLPALTPLPAPNPLPASKPVRPSLESGVLYQFTVNLGPIDVTYIVTQRKPKGNP